MLQTEFIRSMHCNYERILLDKQPEEKKYQYCILGRGGIKGLLSCSLRYLNGLAYLYYDITSKQSITQLYGKRCITRAWLKDFMWSLEQIQTELERFLLDERNILWYPEQIFQDLENNIFSFLYIPYYSGENSFMRFLEYLVERIDYEDEVLVECVFKMHEQFERNGDVYLQTQIFEDAKILNKSQDVPKEKMTNVSGKMEEKEYSEDEGIDNQEELEERPSKQTVEGKGIKKGFRYLLDGKKRRNRNEREQYRRNMQLVMEGYAVAEETPYEDKGEAEEEEYGRTVYVEETGIFKEVIRRLYTTEGRIVMQLNNESYTIGKKKGEVDLVLEDFSVSRMHARISKEQDEFYLEDLNSTNGTFKNGLQLQPYERRKMEEGDEIKFGKVVLIYR